MTAQGGRQPGSTTTHPVTHTHILKYLSFNFTPSPDETEREILSYTTTTTTISTTITLAAAAAAMSGLNYVTFNQDHSLLAVGKRSKGALALYRRRTERQTQQPPAACASIPQIPSNSPTIHTKKTSLLLSSSSRLPSLP